MINLKDTNKYKVSRSNIYAGTLLEPFTPTIRIYDANGKEQTKEDLAKSGISGIEVFGGLVLRKMLFSINKNNVSEDLLYYSPSYRISGYEPKEKVNERFVIRDSINLDDLLKYFEFKEELTSKDIKRIYNLFLRSETFYHNNCELFGVSKYGSNSWGTNGREHPLSFEYYRQMLSIVSSSKRPSTVESEEQPIKARVKTFF